MLSSHKPHLQSVTLLNISGTMNRFLKFYFNVWIVSVEIWLYDSVCQEVCDNLLKVFTFVKHVDADMSVKELHDMIDLMFSITASFFNNLASPANTPTHPSHVYYNVLVCKTVFCIGRP